VHSVAKVESVLPPKGMGFQVPARRPSAVDGTLRHCLDIRSCTKLRRQVHPRRESASIRSFASPFSTRLSPWIGQTIVLLYARRQDRHRLQSVRISKGQRILLCVEIGVHSPLQSDRIALHIPSRRRVIEVVVMQPCLGIDVLVGSSTTIAVSNLTKSVGRYRR
jgi:hypothetical protein